MDSVIRQTGMHLEYEPEWEGAFNLQLKQDDIISEFLDWCGRDVSTFNYFSSFWYKKILKNIIKL